MTTTNIIPENIKKQYEAMKAKHPDAVLLFYNDTVHPATYDIYQDDAILAVKLLDLELVFSEGESKLSFPHYSLDIYLSRLVRAGHRVAICEQLDPPTKFVKRGTPQTAQD